MRRVALPHDAKVAVCVPSNGAWRDQFGWALAGMLLWTAKEVPQLPVEFCANSSSCIPFNRAQLIGEAINRYGASHVLFLDSDMTFPRDALCRLLAHDRGVVGTAYANRAGAKVVATESLEKRTPLAIANGEKGLRRVEAMGLGLTLIRTSVFDDVPPSCFEMRWIPELEHVEGEDYSFFRALKAAGIPAYADINLSWKVGHIGATTFGLQHALAATQK